MERKYFEKFNCEEELRNGQLEASESQKRFPLSFFKFGEFFCLMGINRRMESSAQRGERGREKGGRERI